MIRLLIRDGVDAPVLLTWLFLLLFANTVAMIYFWRGRKHHAVAIAIVIANPGNTLISIGANYFLWTSTFDPGDYPRILAWNPKPWQAGIALYFSFATLAILLGVATWMVKSGRNGQSSLNSMLADLLPVFFAILIALITVRIPFVVQAVTDAMP